MICLSKKDLIKYVLPCIQSKLSANGQFARTMMHNHPFVSEIWLSVLFPVHYFGGGGGVSSDAALALWDFLPNNMAKCPTLFWVMRLSITS